MEYIKEAYNLPFLKKGLSILFRGRKGKVVGTHSSYIKVKFENGEIGCLHPTWEIAYFEADKLLKDYRKKQENNNG